MPDVARSQIVPIGITATAPFTPNTLQMAATISPPTITDSVYKQSANARSLSMGSGAAFGAANDQIAIGTNVVFTSTCTGLVAIGHDISSTLSVGFNPAILMGNGVVCNVAGAVVLNTGGTSLTHAAGSASIAIGSPNDIGLGCVSIGAGITTTVNQSRNVLIGFGVFCSSGSASDNTLIGSQAQGTGLTQCTGIGSSLNFGSNALTGSILIGYTATIQGAKNHCVVIGNGTIGGSASPFIYLASGLNDATIPANSFILGGPNNPMNRAIIGRGQTHTATVGGLTIQATNGITTNNLAMGDMNLDAPLGTGTGAPGAISFRVGQIQAAGNTQHVQVVGAQVLDSVVADDTYLLVRDVTAGVLKRVSRGALNSGAAGFRLLMIPN